MTWQIEIKMYGPEWDRDKWRWTTACIAYSIEMAGIIERALTLSGQEVRTIEVRGEPERGQE